MESGDRYDTSPLGAGKNWVNKVGGLPLFARAIAHALMRDGHSESEAIQLAIGVMKNWAAGEGKVTPKTRAKAAAAIAQWEAMKAASHGSRATQSTGKSSSGRPLTGDHAVGHKFYGNQHTGGQGGAPMSTADAASGLGLTPAQTYLVISQYQKANGMKVTGTANPALLKTIKSSLGLHLQGVAIGSKAGPAAKAAGGGSKSAASKAATAAKSAAAKSTAASKSASKRQATAAASAQLKATAATTALNKATTAATTATATEQARIASANTSAKAAIASAQAKVEAAKSASAKATATANVTAVEASHAASIETVQKSAQAAIDAANNRVTLAQQKSDAAQEALTAANKAAGVRDGGFGSTPVTESSSAGDLLPRGPVPQPPRPRQAKSIFDPTNPHAFRGANLLACAGCGQPATAAIHTTKRSRGARAFNEDEARGTHGEWAKVLEALAKAVREPGAGGTFHQKTGVQPNSGFAVAEQDRSHIAKPEHLETTSRRKRFLGSFFKKNRESFRDPNKHVGIWHDPENSEIVLDPSDVIGDRKAAEDAGAARNQQGVYNLGAAPGEDPYIPTGGTGDRETATHFDPEATGERQEHRGHERLGDRLDGGRDLLAGRSLRGSTGVSQAVADIERLTGRSGSRHAGHNHAPVSTGHVAGNVHRSRVAQKAAFISDADSVETQFHGFATKLFAQQEAATLSRLKGKRGRQMMNRAGATPPPPSDDEVQPTVNQVPPDASNIFDLAFWASKTADLAQPIYDAAGVLSRNRVRGQLGQLGATVPEGSDEMGSLASVTSILQARANRMAQSVSQTTFDNIQGQLTQGVAKGETLGQLTNRVRGVFADASRSRAQTIARTESIGALNEAAQTYATNLPQGIVGSHEWLAHHDDRTRATHRLADRQRRPISLPFHVGTSLMMFPGDPAAPADEVINCRCSQAFLPAVKSLEVAA